TPGRSRQARGCIGYIDLHIPRQQGAIPFASQHTTTDDFRNCRPATADCQISASAQLTHGSTCAGYGDIAGGPQCVVADIPAAAVEIHPIAPKLDDHRRGSQMYVAAMTAGGAELKYVGQRLGAGAGQTFGVLCTT